MKKVKGKRVLITGGASGIGFCTAVEFAREGCEIILTDINEEALKEAGGKIKGLGVKVHTYVNNVSDNPQVKKLAKDVLSKIGGVDILVNNAGVGFSAELKDTTLKDWKRLLDINVWGTIHFVHAFLPSMIERKSGNIVNISSGQAIFPQPTWGAYAATKFCVAGFSEALHYEVARFGIKVTTVFPFIVNSPFYDEIKADTPALRMVLKFLPYYAVSPEKTGRIIVKAVKRGKKFEMHHFLQKGMYRFMRLTPAVVEGAGLLTAWVLTRRKQEG